MRLRLRDAADCLGAAAHAVGPCCGWWRILQYCAEVPGCGCVAEDHRETDAPWRKLRIARFHLQIVGGGFRPETIAPPKGALCISGSRYVSASCCITRAS